MAVENLDQITDEEYFGHLKLMFQSTGWAIVLAELRDNVRFIDDIQNTKDERDLDYRRGQLATIATLLNFEETIARAEKDLSEHEDSPE